VEINGLVCRRSSLEEVICGTLDDGGGMEDVMMEVEEREVEDEDEEEVLICFCSAEDVVVFGVVLLRRGSRVVEVEGR